MLTLYLSPGASSMAPHIGLYEAGAAFETQVISFNAKQHESPQYRTINPDGKVPALLIDGSQVLTEVAAILYYVARRYPQARLWPDEDVLAQSQVLSWMSFCASTLHPARRQGAAAVLNAYALAERRLSRGSWIVGSYSIADIHLFRLYWRVRNAYGPNPRDFPSLEDHHVRMLSRPAVCTTLAVEAAMGYELPQ